MGTASRQLRNGATVFGLGMAALTGCQTYPAGFGGMTLPSPHYLKHQPQYFPPDPTFPLQRELNAMQDPDSLGRGGIGGPLAAPAPGPGQVQPPLPAVPPLTGSTPGVTPVPPQVQPPAPVGGAANPPATSPPITPGTGR